MAKLVGRGEGGGGAAEEGGGEALERGGDGGVRVRVGRSGGAVAPPVEKVEEEEEEKEESGEGNGEVNGDESGAREMAVGRGGGKRGGGEGEGEGRRRGDELPRWHGDCEGVKDGEESRKKGIAFSWGKKREREKREKQLD